jgi:hypothetical protein
MRNVADDLYDENDPLLQLIQDRQIDDESRKGEKPIINSNNNFVGWIYSIDYDQALVMTNDMFKYQVKGVPHNCFLVASSFNPDSYSQVQNIEKEVILLRVLGSAKLPQDDKSIQTKIDAFQRRRSQFVEQVVDANDATLKRSDYDPITRNQLQFHGLKCRVLGTFFVKSDKLQLGSDLESFLSATSFQVYRPRLRSLSQIVNYVDPLRLQKAKEDAKELGVSNPIPPFKLGTIRYTSTDRLHRSNESDLVPFYVQPSDFLARRTAVLGMTRTGKSNMVKQMVSVVMDVARKNSVKIGQVIYDINGEYANANSQDKGSIADIFSADTIRYSLLPPSGRGFKDLRINFYQELAEGFSLIKEVLNDAGRLSNDYINYFVGMSLEEPGETEKKDKSLYNRWQVLSAAYKVLLYRAGFPLTEQQAAERIFFPANSKVVDAVNKVLNPSLSGQESESDDADISEEDSQTNSQIAFQADSKKKETSNSLNPKNGLSFPQAVTWFKAAREANRSSPLPSSTKGKDWVDETLNVVLDMIAQKGKNDSFISGFALLARAKEFHSPEGNNVVAEEIFNYLKDGKIVILDLSVGSPDVRERLSKKIASRIFNNSMKFFTEGKNPPNILVYVEEAHNLIGKDMKLSETWPRLAKEGAKYKIGLVYATQEVSAVHPNILSNTENWFVTHLNNERELRELSRFYDFEDFSQSLLRAQDVGFARVKTLSSPFVVPVQIDLFNPENHKS